MCDEVTKVLLYVYPRLGEISKAVSVSIENRAVLSFRSPENTLGLCERIAEDIFLRMALDEAEEAIGRAVERLTEEERGLYEYKYLRAKKNAGTIPDEDYSLRTYYRKQNAVLKKVAALLEADGWSDKRFFDAFSNCPFMMRALRAVKEGKDSHLPRSDRKKRRSVAQTKSPTSRGLGFLPKRTKAATATAATAPRQMSTI